MSELFSEIVASVESADRILVISHDRPDGDAIGSAVGMAMILKKLGKTVTVMNADPVPEVLSFLPGVDLVKAPQSAIEVDLIMALDSAGQDRIGEQVWASVGNETTLINIDHHISNTKYGDLNWVDSESPATGQIVYQIAESAGWEMDAAIAENLYVAISTDTGSFRYPATTASTFRIAGALVDLGLNVGEINRNLYESFPRRRAEMLKYLLQTMEIGADGRYASLTLPIEVTEKLGLKTGDTEGAIDAVREIDTVIVAVLFEELENGKIRVSSRSKDPHYSVGDLCAGFGGGGHTLAAGARMAGPIGEARKRFMERVRAMLDVN